MANPVTIRTTLIAIAFAVAAGVYMQYGTTEGAAGTQGAVAPSGAAPVPALMMATNGDGRRVFGLPDVAARPSDHLTGSLSMVQVHSVYAELHVPVLRGLMAAPVAGCAARLDAQPVAAAMVTLTATLPCAQNRDIVVAHDSLRISARTDDDGAVEIDLPAVSEDAVFTVLVDNVEQGAVTVQVPDIRDVHRAIVQWRGVQNLQLHAFAPGAKLGDAGHIWSASVPDPAGQGGGVHRFGSADVAVPELAEVFTITADQGGLYDLRIGIAVTAQNCGQGLRALAYQLRGDELRPAQPVSVILPGCNAVGTNVMLDGLFDQGAEARR